MTYGYTLSVAHAVISFRRWGLAAFDAYRTYGDPGMLSIAVLVWNMGLQYMITAENANEGKQPTRNVTFEKVCGGGKYPLMTTEIIGIAY